MNSKALILLSTLAGTSAFQLASQPVARSLPSCLSAAASENNDAEISNTSRRAFCTRSLSTLASASIFSTVVSPQLTNAAELKLEPYEDNEYGFKLQVPSTWENTEQKLSGRRKGIFFTDPTSKDGTTGAIETFGFIAYTPIRDDFTSLGSFGSVDEVAAATILPKGELAGNNESSKMLSATSKNNAYYFDHVATPVVPTEVGSGSAMEKTLKQQHFRTIFTLLPLKGASGLTLVTVTLQTTEERYGDVKGVFDAVIDSYGKLK